MTVPTPSREPVMTLSIGLIAAGAAVLVAFGISLTDEQILALCNLAQAALSLGLYVRSKVTPTKAVSVAPPPVT